jgi:hypothetical protein
MTCTKCQEVRPLKDFHKGRRGKLRGQCRSCRNDYLRAWAKRNPEKLRAQKLRHRYGLSIEKFDELLKVQGRSCAICNSIKAGRKTDQWLLVDHSHDSKEVRGLLCHKCNVGLGAFKDTPEILLRAFYYLIGRKK